MNFDAVPPVVWYVLAALAAWKYRDRLGPMLRNLLGLARTAPPASPAIPPAVPSPSSLGDLGALLKAVLDSADAQAKDQALARVAAEILKAKSDAHFATLASQLPTVGPQAAPGASPAAG